MYIYAGLQFCGLVEFCISSGLSSYTQWHLYRRSSVDQQGESANLKENFVRDIGMESHLLNNEYCITGRLYVSVDLVSEK